MDLAEFVEETLTEILAGIHAAQHKQGGGSIGAEMAGTEPETGQLVTDAFSRHFTIVDFDVSVVVENRAGGKGGLKVWGTGIEGQRGQSSQQTSRIKFSVPLLIPQGDKAPPSPFDRDLG